MTKAVFIRHGAKPPPAPPKYVIVFQCKPKGFSWQYATQLAFPQLFDSRSEADAAFALMGGFQALARMAPNYATDAYKHSASVENARRWIRSQRRHHA
jgi:hypothetical protein